jgi:hypothetical protein
MTQTTLESLAQPVHALEHPLAVGVCPGSSATSRSAWMCDVQQITAELFPGPFSYGEESDPEYPADICVVINVESTGDMRDIIRRQCEWHERIRAFAPDLSGKLRLSISPR